MLSKKIEIQNIDHLGIVAKIVDAIGLVEIINDLIGEEKGEKVNPGHVVKVMILNGLGFISKPLCITTTKSSAECWLYLVLFAFNLRVCSMHEI